ncbi:TPA: hypothetical protein ACPVZR_004561 [Vibrio parahaemolyticus]
MGIYMNLPKKELVVYNKARNFLLANTPDEVTDEILDSYLSLPEPSYKCLSINELYKRLLFSAQNANMKTGVIGGSIGGVEKLSSVLFDFDPEQTFLRYQGNAEKLLDEIVLNLKPKGKIRRTPRSLWPKYCETIISASEFLRQFSDSQEFFEWAESFHRDKKSLAALPMLIDAEVQGVGFPLACDFLKELGFTNYGKPDVHIIEIFEASGLVAKGATNYQILKAISRIADSTGFSSYNVDKLFWLIGSGYFYNHPGIGNKGRVGKMKEAFITSLESENA